MIISKWVETANNQYEARVSIFKTPILVLKVIEDSEGKYFGVINEIKTNALVKIGPSCEKKESACFFIENLISPCVFAEVIDITNQ